MSKHLFGMHDFSYEWVDLVRAAGKTAWAVNTEAIGHDPNDRSGKNYDTCGGTITHIARINNAYGSGGTIPLPEHYDDFAIRFANFVAASSGCDIWIVGNEALCLDWEWPDGKRITMDQFVDCYLRVHKAVKAVKPSAILVPQPPASWNVNGKYQGNESGDWIQQLTDMLNRIGAGNVDAIALHVYAMEHNRDTILSQAKMDPPFNHRSKTFQTYREFMEAIPPAFRNLPVYITESNPDGWQDTNNGWIQEAYAELDRWNQDPAHQPIRCLCFYRWPNEDRDKFHIRSKPGVVEDFRNALSRDYTWPMRTFAAGTPIGAAMGSVVASTATFAAGDIVQTRCAARLRNAPNASGEVVSNLNAGIRCMVTGASRTGNGLTWWPVAVGPLTGFVAQAAPDGTVILEVA